MAQAIHHAMGHERGHVSANQVIKYSSWCIEEFHNHCSPDDGPIPVRLQGKEMSDSISVWRQSTASIHEETYTEKCPRFKSNLLFKHGDGQD